jgi:hypothetical protein
VRARYHSNRLKENLISQSLDYHTETEQLYKAVDPRYCNLEKDNSELLINETLENAVNTEEGKEVLNKYLGSCLEVEEIKTMAWFHLGFATAIRLFGNWPAIKLIDGSRKDEPKPSLKGDFTL